jgi:hypothetical protein
VPVDGGLSIEAISLISAPAMKAFSNALAMTTTVTSSIRSASLKAWRSSRPNSRLKGLVGGRLREMVRTRPACFIVRNL